MKQAAKPSTERRQLKAAWGWAGLLLSGAALPAPATDIPVAPEARTDGLAAPFAELDKDQNGTLSPVEYTRSPDPTLPFVELDADGDERITPAEYEVVLERARNPGNRAENRAENRELRDAARDPAAPPPPTDITPETDKGESQ